jgi:hypothetical protein
MRDNHINRNYFIFCCGQSDTDRLPCHDAPEARSGEPSEKRALPRGGRRNWAERKSGKARGRAVAVRDAIARAIREANRKYPDTKERRSYAQKSVSDKRNRKTNLKIIKKGADFMQTSKSEREIINARSGRFMQRIGSTVYRVSVFFPDEESETLEAKILRLIKNDLIYAPERGMMEPLQTGRLPDGGSL